MKRILLSAIAMVFSAGISFAQLNVSTISQTGESHEAIANQTGSSNASDVDMTGEKGFAKTNQVGINNDADIDQLGGAFNDAIITQTGDDNQGSIYQEGSRNFARSESAAGIRQVGDANTFSISQFSDPTLSPAGNNRAQAMFFGDANSGSIAQGTSLINTRNNNAVVSVGTAANQGHHANNVVIGQWNDNNTALAEILGSSNVVSVDQLSAGNSARVTIDGSGNTATVSQN